MIRSFDKEIILGRVGSLSLNAGYIDRFVDDRKNFAMVDEVCCCLFQKERFGLYSILLEAMDGTSALDKVKSIDYAISTMLINTDALLIRGIIAKSNKACLSLAPMTVGNRITDTGNRFKYTVSIARWSKSFGINRAVEEISNNGSVEKAKRLLDSAIAQGQI